MNPTNGKGSKRRPENKAAFDNGFDKIFTKKKTMINSPCIGTCLYDPETLICAGCHRTPEEISTWVVMTDEQKLKVLERIKEIPERGISRTQAEELYKKYLTTR